MAQIATRSPGLQQTLICGRPFLRQTSVCGRPAFDDSRDHPQLAVGGLILNPQEPIEMKFL
jgi:hypothetical protein